MAILRVKRATLLALCGGVSLAAAGVDTRLADTRLIEAAKEGKPAVIRALIRQHADVNAREIDGTTALHWAVRSDDRESVQVLMRAGARVNVTNRYGLAPLSLAATNGNPEIVSLLLESGADPDTASPEGETALMTAAKAGNPGSVVALLDHGADVNSKEHWFNETALMWAAAENHAEVTRTLIDHGADINARSAQQEFARFRFNLATMVNTVLPRGGLTALMLAARQGGVETARVLVDAGADLNVTDPDGTSALVIAILNGHYDVGAVLVEHGADLNLADVSGMAAVYATVDLHTQPPMINRPTRKPSGSVENLDLLGQLLAHGADPDAGLKAVLLARYHNTGDPQLGPGTTPLMRAAKSLDVAAMRVLLDAGADPALRNRNSATALMFAAGLGRNGFGGKSEAEVLEAVSLCLDRGADINAENSNGQTALHIAVEQSDAVVALLARRGAKLDIKDKQGHTPLDVALGDAPQGRGSAPARAADARKTTAALLRQMMSGGAARGAAPAE
jgi:ankyrin repeat protein